jgi:hypothetical protein
MKRGRRGNGGPKRTSEAGHGSDRCDSGGAQSKAWNYRS